MKDIYAYNPDICDGDYCPMNCDICPKKDAAETAAMEPDDSSLEMGFDPYLGCYTDDC